MVWNKDMLQIRDTHLQRADDYKKLADAAVDRENVSDVLAALSFAQFHATMAVAYGQKVREIPEEELNLGDGWKLVPSDMTQNFNLVRDNGQIIRDTVGRPAVYHSFEDARASILHHLT